MYPDQHCLDQDSQLVTEDERLTILFNIAFHRQTTLPVCRQTNPPTKIYVCTPSMTYHS
jgi:hypothetical protein